MSASDPELLRIFREETLERLDRIVALLLAAEEGEEAVDALFREAHSIKGNCGMVGLADAAAVAGAMEDVLDRAREAAAFPREATGALLAATDAIRQSVQGEEGAPEAAREAVAGLTGAGDGAPSPIAPGEEVSAPPDAGPRGATPTTAPAEAAGEAVETSAASAAASPSSPGRASTVRVGTEKIDRLLDVVGETVLHRRRLEHLIAEQGASEALEDELGGGTMLLEDLQDSVIDMRTLPLSSIVGRLPRAVRDLAADLGKEVTLAMAGTETQLDRLVLDGLADMIIHVLRNALDHGIEPPEEREAAGKPRTGRLTLSAEQRGGQVAVTVADDGRGVGEEVARRAAELGSLTEVLTQPGFSTAEEITEVSGRGVGLDAVRTHVEGLGGDVEIESEPGRGTAVTMLLPLTLALLDILLVERGGGAFGIPLSSVAEALAVDEVTSLEGRPSIDLRGETVALTDLAAAIGARAPAPAPHAPAVVVSVGGHRVAVRCDRLVGDQEAVVKSMGPLLAQVPGYLGAAILPDGRLALILDPGHLVRRDGAHRARLPVAADPAPAAEERAGGEGPVLVVDDQFTIRELQRRILEGAGYEVLTAADGREALEVLAREASVSVMVTDIEMPELDGLALLRQIRADPQRGTLPVVIVSSRGSDADRAAGAEAGADAYMVKAEFDQRTLLDTVARLSGRA